MKAPAPRFRFPFSVFPFTFLFSLFIFSAVGCKRSPPPTSQLTYDQKTGKLTRITADLNHDGVIDTWTYMDGTKMLRVEQDLDQDGKIDRWTYTTPDAKVIRTAISNHKNGKPDEWLYPDPADPSQTARIEYSSTSDEHRIDRREFYEHGKLVRVEADTNGDGKIDTWEVHDGPAVVSAEFDTDHDGKPDMRDTFGAAGKLLSTETEPDGHGGYRKKQVF